jgi:prephenate dehydrogenase
LKIAVLGSSGGMGAYFVRRFLREGHTVTGYDPKKGNAQSRLLLARSNARAVIGADVTLLSVPIGETGKVGREIAPNLKDGSILVEISSIKTGVREELQKALKGSDVKLVSVHPMFGPRSTSRAPRILVLGSSRDLAISRSIFPQARLIPMKEKDHDRIMAYALNLVHVLNLAFLSALSKNVGIQEFRKVSGPLGIAQLTLGEAVLSQDPSLYSFIQLENPFAAEAISSLVRELQGLMKVIHKKDDEFERRFASMSQEFPEARLSKAIQAVYSSFDYT